MNSGGHLCGMLFDQNYLLEAEQTQTYNFDGGSGNQIIMHFCPNCATHLYAYPTEYKGKVVVRANTLVNMDFQPQQSLFAESAFAWDKPFIKQD